MGKIKSIEKTLEALLDVKDRPKKHKLEKEFINLCLKNYSEINRNQLRFYMDIYRIIMNYS